MGVQDRKVKWRPDLNLGGGRGISIAKPSSLGRPLQARQRRSERLRCVHLWAGLPNVHRRGEDTPALLLSQQPVCRMDVSMHE